MINWSDIKIKANATGNIKTTCPSCSHTRKKKNDPCLSVNIEKGVARCWNCDDVSFKNRHEANKFDLPPQNWMNYTSLSDGMVKWFKSRGISQKTLIECKVTEEKYYQPAKNKEVNNLVFNYFYGDMLVNKKFRSADKYFTQCKNAKKVFYGINDIEDFNECYIVEGEMDKLSLWEAGVKNCISVPNGANDLNDIFETCEDELKKIEKFYISVDNDEAGQKLEKALINRLGKWKCSKIEFKHGKDANDELQSGLNNLLDALDSPVHYPIDGTFTALDIQDEIFDLYDNGDEETIKPLGETWQEFNSIFSILMGQLTVVTGIPSSGKSNFIEFYVLELIKDFNLKASFYSPEHLPMKKHHEVLSEKVIGKPFAENDYTQRMSKKELNEYIEWTKDKVYLTVPEKGDMVDWDWILEKFKEQCFRYGINIFVIDAFNKIKRKNGESLAEISEILGRLALFCQAYNIHVFLIAHPTKQKKNEQGEYDPPDLYSVKGSGDFRDQTHNGLCVHRIYGSTEREVAIFNLKAKFKNQGSDRIGESVVMKYNLNNGRYFTHREDNESWLKVDTKEIAFNKTESSLSDEQLKGFVSGYGEDKDVFSQIDQFNDDLPF